MLVVVNRQLEIKWKSGHDLDICAQESEMGMERKNLALTRYQSSDY